MSDGDFDLGKSIQDYIEYRDILTEERHKFEAMERDIKARMSEIEASILEFQRRVGLTAVSTNTHTAYMSEKVQVRLADWDKFSDYLLRSGNVHCLEKRPAKLACLELEKEFLASDTGESFESIGLNKHTEKCVLIRKK